MLWSLGSSVQQWRSRGGRDHYLSLATLLKTAVFSPFFLTRNVFIKMQNRCIFCIQIKRETFQMRTAALPQRQAQKNTNLFIQNHVDLFCTQTALKESSFYVACWFFFMVFSSNKWFAKKRRRINVWYHYLITLESKRIWIDKQNLNRSNSNDT